VVGVGGFVNLTQASRKVVFLTTFTTKGLTMAFEDNQLQIVAEGNIKKFVEKLDQISFNGGIAMEEKRQVLYVTERCVFQLTPEGLQLIEVAPGMDVQKDILEQMEFTPLLAENLKVMDRDFFRI
jgi:propionate CoA-transferase